MNKSISVYKKLGDRLAEFESRRKDLESIFYGLQNDLFWLRRDLAKTEYEVQRLRTIMFKMKEKGDSDT